MTDDSILTINGTQYKVGDLSTAARTQLANIQVVDAEINRRQQQLAIAQTARSAYMATLLAALPKAAAAVAAPAAAPAAKKPAARKPRASKA